MVSLKWGYARRTTPPAGEVTSTYGDRRRAGRACVLAGLAIGHGFLTLSASADAIDFARDIQPILSRNCYECHGPDAHARQAELRLDIALLRKDMEAQVAQCVIRLGALIVVVAGLMLGAMQLSA